MSDIATALTPTLLSQGIDHFQAGRFEAADAVYQAVLDVDPWNTDALHLRGLARARLMSPLAGARLIRQALMASPAFAVAYTNLGNLMARADDHEAAIPSYRRALRIDASQKVADDGLKVAFNKAVTGPWGDAPIAPGEDVVIYQHHAGLGDNLLYSTLPALFAARGHRVYVSDMNATRNEEIHQLVWGANPHVAGVSSLPAKAGMARLVVQFDRLSHVLNWLTRIEVAHGFPPTNDLPRVYHRSTPHPALAGRVVVDTNSSTIKYPPEEIATFVRATCARFHYRPDELIQLRFARPGVSDSNGELPGVASHTITSIFELCDALASAKAFITVHSGANTLAAALKGDAATPMIHCAVDAEHYNQKCYIWRNIDYTIVRSLGTGGDGAVNMNGTRS